MGFPETSDDILVLNYCILHTKYYIYIQRLFKTNVLDQYACQTQIKFALNIVIKEMDIKRFKKFPISMKTYDSTQANSQN